MTTNGVNVQEVIQRGCNDIVAEVKFQDVFNVSLSNEISLPQTQRSAARKMLMNSGLFRHCDKSLAGLETYTCNCFEWNRKRYLVSVFFCNPDDQYDQYDYCVTLRDDRIQKHAYGDNLVQLLYEMLKQEM